MVANLVMPQPLGRMLEHLDIDIAVGFETMPDMMEDAIIRCMRCKMFKRCDYDLESRYFTCPNRDLFDQLERIQGNV